MINPASFPLPPTSSYRKELEAARNAALRAGEIIRRNYSQPHTIRHKGRIDIVTETDIAAEKAILDTLEDFSKEIHILSEETHADSITAAQKPTWIIDPLDGTTNFAHGFPYFAVSIAYSSNNQVEAGLVFCPMQNELFWAVRQEGAWLNDTPIQVSPTTMLENALIGTGFPYNIDATLPVVMRHLHRILPRVQDVRRAGAAAVDLVYLACGRLDGFWEMDLQPWDTAAAALITQEAGGHLTNFSGTPFSPFFPEVLASNTHLHPALIRLMAKG